MKPLNKKATKITSKEEIIEPRSIPRNPVDHTSDNKLKKSCIKKSLFSYFKVI
jgi:hypothetical protein